jgi:hypothetical protein
MACKLIISLPINNRGPDVEAVYEDVGELEVGSPAGLKALYSDARKRAAVAAGIGAYLYTSLQPPVRPIGPEDRQLQVRPGPRGRTSWFLSPNRGVASRPVPAGDERRGDPPRPRRDPRPRRARLSAGQGEAAEQSLDEPASSAAETREQTNGATGQPAQPPGNGLVVVDFGGHGPDDA